MEEAERAGFPGVEAVEEAKGCVVVGAMTGASEGTEDTD